METKEFEYVSTPLTTLLNVAMPTGSDCVSRGYLTTKAYTDENHSLTISGEKEVSDDTKTIIRDGGNTDAICYYEDGRQYNVKSVPKVKDIHLYNNRCVKVDFADGTSETAVYSPEEEDILTAGFAICYLKKMLSVKDGTGSNAFNKVLERAFKAMENAKKTREKAEKAKAEAKAKKKREAEKKARKAQRRKDRMVELIALATKKAGN